MWLPTRANEQVTIASGVVNCGIGGTVELTSESGSADTVTQITGLGKGQRVMFQAASGHTITFAHGTYLKLERSANREISSNDKLEMEVYNESCVCHEIGRPSPGA